jgi:hypothetical protein
MYASEAADEKEKRKQVFLYSSFFKSQFRRGRCMRIYICSMRLRQTHKWFFPLDDVGRSGAIWHFYFSFNKNEEESERMRRNLSCT